MADEKKTSTVNAVVVSDSYSWHEESNDPTSERHDAAKGETITVSAAEFQRSQEMVPAGLAKVGSDEAKVALGELPEPDAPLTTPAGEPVGEVAPSDDDAPKK